MEILNMLTVQLHDVTMLSTFIRLLLAAIFGGIIGIERERRRRAAGLRTHMLVCLGAALVMIINQYAAEEFALADPTRLGAQVISGIGFLGVGTIIVNRQQHVKGLTTAAGLWACACVGLAVGVGFYSGALMASLFIVTTAAAMNRLENYFINRVRGMEIYAAFEDYGMMNNFLKLLAERHIKVCSMDFVLPRGDKDRNKATVAVEISLHLPKKRLHSDIMEQLMQVPGLVVLEEM